MKLQSDTLFLLLLLLLLFVRRLRICFLLVLLMTGVTIELGWLDLGGFVQLFNFGIMTAFHFLHMKQGRNTFLWKPKKNYFYFKRISLSLLCQNSTTPHIPPPSGCPSVRHKYEPSDNTYVTKIRQDDAPAGRAIVHHRIFLFSRDVWCACTGSSCLVDLVYLFFSCGYGWTFHHSTQFFKPVLPKSSFKHRFLFY